MPSFSTNKNFTIPQNLGDAGLWGAELNTTIGLLDTLLGSVLTLQSSAGNVTLTSSQASNLAYVLQGTLAAPYQVAFTSSLGGNGIYVIDNQTTGNFVTTVTQTSSLSVALTIPQGGRSIIYGNGTSFFVATDNQTAKLYTRLGTPQGNVAGSAGTSNGSATSEVWDGTNLVPYACTTTGTSSSAIWSAITALPIPQGYLSPSNTLPVYNTDFSSTSLFYVPFQGNWTVLSNGTALYPYRFSTMTLSLTNTQAASQIYDVFMYFNAGTPVIGTGPTWAAGGGSVTIGSCARGTGAGSTDISRLQGVWTNTVQVTLNNGLSTYTCPANQGIYLGSIYMDTTPGQVSGHRTYGQARKWGIFNAYNRVPLFLQAGDPTASWTYNTNTIRASNNNSNNSIVVFSGLAEECANTSFLQKLNESTGTATQPRIGIGLNGTVATAGTDATINGSGITTSLRAEYDIAPFLGINAVFALEVGAVTGGLFYGTQSNMLLKATWRV